LLILGIDTATRFGSVGLLRTDGCDELLSEVTEESGRAHGARLLDLIDRCLDDAGTSIDEVSCVAVSIGPGSFTGLRVGLATAKGLALAGAVDMVGVATLEALAVTAVYDVASTAKQAPGGGLRPPYLVCACLDARKREVYAALFAVDPPEPDGFPRLTRVSPDVALAPAELAEDLSRRLGEGASVAGTKQSSLVLVGDGAERYPELILGRLEGRAAILPSSRVHPRGGVVARLGARQLEARGADDLASLVPRYVRASEAEVKRSGK
jgi:tRNA threonylcarbamoyladenosine biosynthesis protein TsaB